LRKAKIAAAAEALKILQGATMIETWVHEIVSTSGLHFSFKTWNIDYLSISPSLRDDYSLERFSLIKIEKLCGVLPRIL
jgi:hypothetical protein